MTQPSHSFRRVHPRRQRRLWRANPRSRKAAAVAELAVVLPILMIMVFGTLEICERLLLRQSAAVAAYETARMSARRTMTAERATARGLEILESRRIEGGNININPSDLSEIKTGEQIRVTVLVPINNNTLMQYVLPSSGNIRVRAFMVRE